ncbi:MAG: sialidase family protein, partial [Planctomycetota bacterium]
PLDNRPTPQCHASTIVETRSGLVAAWFGGKHEKNPDVGIWVSRRDGDGWSRPVEVANGVQSPDLRHPCWNPVLFLPKGGPLTLFYKVGPSPSAWWGMLVRSDDGGQTWSEPRKLGEGPLGHLIGPVKNKPIQLEEGAILCPSSTEHDGWRVHFELTGDLGKTWEVVGPINDGKEFGAIQPSILTYSDGRMQVTCRSRQSVVTQSWSEDGGKTWSKMTATSLPNPNAGIDAVTLEDGRQLIVYNHTVRGGGFPSGRNMLNVAVSTDGRDWTPVLTLERSESEYSYPAVIQSSDGKVHVTYTFRRQAVKHVVLDPAAL